MRHSIIATAAVASVAGSAMATVTGNKVFGDSYVVQDGSTKYSVLDVYVKSNSANDIFALVVTKQALLLAGKIFGARGQRF